MRLAICLEHAALLGRGEAIGRPQSNGDELLRLNETGRESNPREQPVGSTKLKCMFAVLIRFDVKPGRDGEFVAAWTILTETLRDEFGSHGSCLHIARPGTYMAYARWPSREAWAAPWDLPKRAFEAREVMRDCCTTVETMHELEVQVDRLAIGHEAPPPPFEIG